MSYAETLLRCTGMLAPAILCVLVLAPYIGAALNRRAARKSLRIMHGALHAVAPELCTPECWE